MREGGAAASRRRPAAKLTPRHHRAVYPRIGAIVAYTGLVEEHCGGNIVTNYCSNRLTIEGTPEEIDSFAKDCLGFDNESPELPIMTTAIWSKV